MTSLFDLDWSEVYYDTTSSTLRDGALAPATLRAYHTNVNKFLQFTRLTSIKHLLRLKPIIIDQRLAEYIDHLFASRGSYSYAVQALYGLIYLFPPIRPFLGESRLRIRGWNRLREHYSHPPITWELTVVFAATMAKWGHHAEAVACLLSFDCLLRVGEMTRLTYHDIVQPNDARMGSAHTGMIVRLARAKTGLNQSVALENPNVQTVLHSYLLAYPFMKQDRIFPFTSESFRRLIHRVSSALGLGDIAYVPHSFRHGGATYLYQRGSRIEDIMFRGRWLSLESARRYIQTARALLIRLDIPDELNRRGASLAPCIDDVLQHFRDTVPSAGRTDPRVWFRPS
jgi:integrase